MSPEVQQALREGAREVFGVRLDFDAFEGGRRLTLGGGLPVVWADTKDLGETARLLRWLSREAELQTRLHRAESQRDLLKQRTLDLLPRSPGGSALLDWQPEEADLRLLSHLDAVALLVDGEAKVNRGLHPGDVLSTWRVLEQQAERSIRVGGGALYGVRSGSVSVVCMHGSCLQDTDRQLAGFLARWYDRLLAERAHVRAIEALKAQAEGAAKARAHFISTINHELRTPLNGILGTAQVLSRGALDAEQAELVGLLVEGAVEMRRIANSVLDLSKIESGKMELLRRPTHIVRLLERCIQSQRYSALEKGLMLELRVGVELPEWGLIDGGRVMQAVTNLLTNAIKFTAEGTIEVSVQGGPSDELRIEVQDCGIGIAPERQQTVFEPFAQGESTTHREFGGTGLGLPLVREFARLHGGEAGVRSTLGEGSTFWITLQAPACGAEIEESALIRKAQPMRVLVVDDNQTNRLVAQRLLEQDGHQVWLASSGAEALELLRLQPLELALVDNQMPEMDGPELLRRARLEVGQLPQMVAFTASVDEDSRERFLGLGFDGFLAKPLLRDQLRSTLWDARPQARKQAAQ